MGWYHREAIEVEWNIMYWYISVQYCIYGHLVSLLWEPHLLHEQPNMSEDPLVLSVKIPIGGSRGESTCTDVCSFHIYTVGIPAGHQSKWRYTANIWNLAYWTLDSLFYNIWWVSVVSPTETYMLMDLLCEVCVLT